MKPFVEEVFVNHGQSYKAQTPVALGVDYKPTDDADPIFPFKKADGKRYIFTREFKGFFNANNTAAADMSSYDLCGDVDLWICLGAVNNGERKDYDLFFAVDSSAQLARVANYYGLPNPSTSELDGVIDNSPHSIAFWNVSGRAVVPVGVKFIKGKPEILKLYTYPKDDGLWDMWMVGVSYYNEGTVHEAGGYHTRKCGGLVEPGKDYNGRGSSMDEVSISSTRVGGTSTQYTFHSKKSEDPMLKWVGEEDNGPGVAPRTRYFETSGDVRRAVCAYTKEVDFGVHDLCPDVTLWLARSHYGTPSIFAEIYFRVDSVEMLARVATFYGLPVPYDAPLEETLRNAPETIRARHYALGKDKDDFEPVVVASVIQENRRALRLVLYTFLRPWEYAEPLEIPDV